MRSPFARAGLLAAILVHAAPLQAVDVGLREGEAFPDLVLPSMETGELLSISSFRGKKVLLLVFASW